MRGPQLTEPVTVGGVNISYRRECICNAVLKPGKARLEWLGYYYSSDYLLDENLAMQSESPGPKLKQIPLGDCVVAVDVGPTIHIIKCSGSTV